MESRIENRELGRRARSDAPYHGLLECPRTNRGCVDLVRIGKRFCKGLPAFCKGVGKVMASRRLSGFQALVLLKSAKGAKGVFA